MILFMGLLSDPTLVHTMSVCRKEGIEFVFFDTNKFLFMGEYEWNAISGEGFLDNGEILLEFPDSSFSGVYSRLIFLSQQQSQEKLIELSIRMQILMEVISSLKEVIVVNRPHSDQSNRAKMYHLNLLRKCGFLIPQSLLTNRKEEVLRFVQTHSKVIYKGASSEKTIVSLYSSESTKQLDLLQNSPVLFQEYIEGVDIRTHMVGNQFFTEQILSKGIDYRFHKETNTFSTTEIPQSLEEKCLRYQELSSLSFIGFDFKKTTSGKYYIMEANPMPGYDSYDRRLDLKISKALIQLLQGSSPAYT